MLWTEKYQPTCAVEVMGNTANVKKLSTWLDEWRKRFLKEKKKMKKQMRGATKKGDGEELWGLEYLLLCRTLIWGGD